MKKTKAKLELKKCTIRVLQDNALTRIFGGGPPTTNPEVCRLAGDEEGIGIVRPGAK